MDNMQPGIRRIRPRQIIRPGIVLPLLLSILVITGCGGGGGSSERSFSIGGNVSGLSGTLRLVNQTGTTSTAATIASNGSYRFGTKLKNGDSYSVSIAGQPQNQQCSLSNATGTINGADVSNINVSCINLATVSGTLSAAIGISYDSDVNDPNAPYTDNNSAATAQSVSNNVFTLHGFASAEGLSKYGLGGRFATSPDPDDYYKVTLQASQNIQLQVVDYSNFGQGAPYQGDLDLYLYRFNTNTQVYDLVASSETTTEFEQVTTPSAGDYLVRVHAYSDPTITDPGASKYVLRLAPVGLSSARSSTEDFVADEVILKFKNPQAQLSALAAGTNIQGMNVIHEGSDLRGPVVAKINTQQLLGSTLPLPAKNLTAAAASAGHRIDDAKFRTLQAIKYLSKQGNIAYAEPNYILHSLTVPNDKYYNYQWHYPLINLPQAWDITTGTRSGNPVVVAVVDTGVFLAHPDLKNQLVSGYDFISDATRARDGDGIDSNPDDPGDDPEPGKSSWHGTHVSGTIAAQSNDGAGVAGVSWGARIMPIRVLGYGGGTTGDLIQGLRYAAGLSNTSGTLPSQKADIINLSLGGPDYSQALQDTITAIVNAGVIVIAAAGNDNSQLPSYPASCDGVISVSAVTYSKQKASYSNYGPKIDVAAPGGELSQDLNGDGRPDGVLSTIADDSSGSRVAAWAFYQGTSMAAPHVAGVAALMKAVDPGLTPSQFDSLLRSGTITDDLGASGRDDIYGYGLIDANLAVQEANALAHGGSLPPIPAQLAATPSSITIGDNTQATLQLSNIGGTPDPVVNSVTSTAPWLSVTPISTDANGLGSYQLTVDKTGLGDGIYHTTVDISFSRSGAPDAISVTVTMQVGITSSEGSLITQYVVLVDANSTNLDLVDSVRAVTQGSDLTYSFSNVKPGDYFIYSGSDVDNDHLICESGESCGAYPSLPERQRITINGVDRSGLKILVDIQGGVSSNALAAGTRKTKTAPDSLPRAVSGTVGTTP